MTTRLLLSNRAMAAIVADVLAHPATETGGLLPCRIVGNAMIVPFTIPGGSNATRTPSRFSPDTISQQVLLDFAFDLFSVDFGGAWHKHPGLFDQPSAHDLKTAQHIVTDPTWNKPHAVFPIAVIDGGQVRIRAYLMQRSTQVFEEIPVEVIPDADARVVEILSGLHAAKQEVQT